MKQPFPCIESTADVYYKNKRIRLWINEEKVENSYPETKSGAERLSEFINGEKARTDIEIIEFVEKLPRINAVQVMEKTGTIELGKTIYFVEFNEKG